MKRALLITVLAIAFLVAFTGTAFANFGPHGGYSQDTDACAGCHRAHTSFSSVTWEDQAGNDHSALLISSASNMEEFCYACHGDAAPGASTNVASGVFDSGPSGADGVLAGGAIFYETNSSFNATLNGGGFEQTGMVASTSMHNMSSGGAIDPLWGAGNSPTSVTMSCTSCHDPHGSSNYRLLKETVNGNVVGGYDAGGNPQPFVVSSEENYPVGGWLKHEAGAVQMTAYKPNYTSAEYKFLQPDPSYSAGKNRSMTTWCAACHEAYVVKGNVNTGSAPYDYGAGEAAANNGALLGARARHRHPVDISLAAGVGPTRALAQEVIVSDILPLDDGPDAGDVRGEWDTDDYIGCLTCHRAHGTDKTMEGWANARLINNPTAVVTWTVEATTVAPVGVNPNFTSALLRADNRGVCERCHNK